MGRRSGEAREEEEGRGGSQEEGKASQQRRPPTRGGKGRRNLSRMATAPVMTHSSEGLGLLSPP
eukprot:5130241-Pyramimonas_sp.AAC.1